MVGWGRQFCLVTLETGWPIKECLHVISNDPHEMRVLACVSSK